MDLVRRIPEGLEIEGLREGLKHIMKEHEIQFSICEGAAKVLRSEVVERQGLLRGGQRRGVRFEVVVARGMKGEEQGGPGHDHHGHGEKAPTTATVNGNGDIAAKPPTTAAKKWSPGHCAQCLVPFVEWETETLVGFACGHVFHLPHLLERLHPGEEIDEVLLHGVADEQQRSVAAASRLIGAKVTHARLIRDRIAGGCPVCVGKVESE